ncbi:BnaC09g14460D [Brassica napus]|uniref:BnaC09g14460D protein n=1 Tax=Brassica napus TaxID=3708 RepID=A0A078HUN3_BRANA|nr:BnaC09g14460D [Brassica napus]
MAKNLSSVTFTVLLLVLLMASTEILKIEAMNIKARCLPQGCKNATFSEEAVCKGVVEGPDKHCHCYKERHYMCVCVCSTLFCFQIKHQGQSISMLSPKCKLMLCEFFASF